MMHAPNLADMPYMVIKYMQPILIYDATNSSHGTNCTNSKYFHALGSIPYHCFLENGRQVPLTNLCAINKLYL